MTINIAEGVLYRAALISGMTPALIKARSRKKTICRVRQAVMYVLRKRTIWSTPQIGRYMNLSDHTTVLHAIKMIPEYAKWESNTETLIEELMAAPEMAPFSLERSLSGLNLRDATEEVKARTVNFRDKNNKPRKKIIFLCTPPKPVIQKRVYEPEILSPGCTIYLNDDGNSFADQAEIDRMKKGSKNLLSAIIAARSVPQMGAPAA